MLKMTIYVEKDPLASIGKYEYNGNNEIGKILVIISESLLKHLIIGMDKN